MIRTSTSVPTLDVTLDSSILYTPATRIGQRSVLLGPEHEKWPVRDFTIRRGLCNYCRFFLREWPSWPSHEEWQVAYPGDIIHQDHKYFQGSLHRLLARTDFDLSAYLEYEYTRNTSTINYHECEVCALIHATLSLGVLDDEPWIDMRARTSPEGVIEILIWYRANDSRTSLALNCVADLDANAYAQGNPCNILTVNSGDTDFLEKWQNCLHECCRLRDKTADDAWLPRRLVQVIRHGDVSLPSVCIRESAAIQHSPRYLTLSHRWGRNTEFILTESNQETLQSSIPWELIPKTYQDALLITLGMGYNYLWIDSLCILQDSIDDWRSESLLMSKIYSNTSMNIYASCSADEHAGIFSRRDPAHIATSAFQCHWPGMTGSLWSLGMHPSTLYHSHFLSSSKSFLSSRGWVVQEELLPPAVLYFGTTSVLWACIHGCASDTHFGPGHPSSNISEVEGTRLQDLVSIKTILQNGEVIGLEPFSRQIERIWDSIVKRFNVCELKYATDKPVAISGVAQIICSLLHLAPENYLIGIWRPYLMHQLLWHRPTQSLMALYPHLYAPHANHSYDTYVAPSWSWASLQGEVKIPRKKGHELAYLVEATTVSPAGPFGQISSGHLVIHGPVWEIRGSAVGNKIVTLPCGHQINFTPFTPNVARWFDVAKVTLDRPIGDPPSACPSPLYLLGLRLQGFAQSFELHGNWRHGSPTHGLLKLTGLLLERNCDRKGEYRRIGRVSLPFDKMVHSHCEGHSLSEDCYLDHSPPQELLSQVALGEACPNDGFTSVKVLPEYAKDWFLASSLKWTSFGSIKWPQNYADPESFGNLPEDFYTIKLV